MQQREEEVDLLEVQVNKLRDQIVLWKFERRGRWLRWTNLPGSCRPELWALEVDGAWG